MVVANDAKWAPKRIDGACPPSFDGHCSQRRCLLAPPGAFVDVRGSGFNDATLPTSWTEHRLLTFRGLWRASGRNEPYAMWLEEAMLCGLNPRRPSPRLMTSSSSLRRGQPAIPGPGVFDPVDTEQSSLSLEQEMPLSNHLTAKGRQTPESACGFRPSRQTRTREALRRSRRLR